MYVRKKNEEAVSPVIAVILMVAITVVLAGVLYVWVTSLADTSSTTTTTLGVSAEDAAATADQATGTVATTFEDGEEMIKIAHLTGAQINWTSMTKIQCTKVGTDIPITLSVLKVRGVGYTTSNCVSTVGDVVILGIPTGSAVTLPAGSYITVTIVGENSNWNSPKAGFVVN